MCDVRGPGPGAPVCGGRGSHCHTSFLRLLHSGRCLRVPRPRAAHQGARGAEGPSTGRQPQTCPFPGQSRGGRHQGSPGLRPRAGSSATAVSASVCFAMLSQRLLCGLCRSFKECTTWTRATPLSPTATLASVLCSHRYTGSTGEVAEASRRHRPSGAQALGGTRPLGRPSSTTSLETACLSTQLCPATRPAVASGLRGSCCPPATAGPPLPTLSQPSWVPRGPKWPSPVPPRWRAGPSPSQDISHCWWPPGAPSAGTADPSSSRGPVLMLISSRSGAPGEHRPGAGPPLLCPRGRPLLLLQRFDHHDVHCGSRSPPFRVSGADPSLPRKSGRLMALRRAPGVHPTHTSQVVTLA